ncbi:MAG: hypothetical protein QME68_04835 [Elusimicrobiota bacterium]|nr:hypothetical protein [Elusimicrobiota bacterium]
MNSKKLGCICFCIVVMSPQLLLCVTDLIDVPTTEIAEYNTAELNFRLYSTGGIVSRLTFGVLSKRLNISAYWDVDKLIGMESPVPRHPQIGLKFRIYDGSKNIPAIAIGYDGQGYRYDTEVSSGYLHREKGMYFVGDIEILMKNLLLHFGGNVNFQDSQKATGFCFFGLSYSILENEKKVVSLLAEYDNISNNFKENRLNAALRIFAASSLSFDIAFLDIASPKKLDTERIIRVNYQTKL